MLPSLFLSFFLLAIAKGSASVGSEESVFYKTNEGVKSISMNHFLVGCGFSSDVLDCDNNIWLFKIPEVDADIQLYGLGVSKEAEEHIRKSSSEIRIQFQAGTIKMFDFSRISIGDCYLLKMFLPQLKDKLTEGQKSTITGKFKENQLGNPFRTFHSQRKMIRSSLMVSSDSSSKSFSDSSSKSFSDSSSKSFKSSKNSKYGKLTRQLGVAKEISKLAKDGAMLVRQSAIKGRSSFNNDVDVDEGKPVYLRWYRSLKNSLRKEKAFTSGNFSLKINFEFQKLTGNFFNFLVTQQHSITVEGLKEASLSINYFLSSISSDIEIATDTSVFAKTPTRNIYVPAKGGKEAHYLK